MSNELSLTIDAVSREKGINPEDIVHAIEDAILTAARKHYKDRDDLLARFNRGTGQVDLFSQKQTWIPSRTRTVRLRWMKPGRSIPKQISVIRFWCCCPAARWAESRLRRPSRLFSARQRGRTQEGS